MQRLSPEPFEGKLVEPSVGDIFWGFLRLGLTGFGGVLPLARRMIVEERRWLTGEEFLDLLGLCQFLPGGNIVNMATAIGLRFQGPAGVLAALFGLMAAPMTIVIALGTVYDRFQDDIYVRRAFTGLSAAAAGLLASLVLKILPAFLGKPVSLAVAALCFCAVALLRLPLLATMLALAPISIIAIWRLEA